MTRKTRYFMGGSAAILVAGLGTGLVAYYGGGFPSLSASRSGPSELSYVPADSTVVAFANVREVMDSQLRQRLKQVLPQEQGQKEFAQETGIDIEHDIDYVVASLTTGLEKPAPLVVARGRFNDTQLEALIREHGGTIEDYKGKRLIVCTTTAHGDMPIQTGSMTLAFLEPGLIAIGDTAAVKTSIDAQLAAHSITSNNEMMELVSEIGQSNNAWAVGRFDVLASQAHLPEQVSSRLPQLKWFAAAGHVNGGLSGSLRAEARDDQSAENLRDVVRGFLGLARMQAQADPRTSALVESLQLTGTGKTVALSFTVPAEVLEMIPKSVEPPKAEAPK